MPSTFADKEQKSTSRAISNQNEGDGGKMMPAVPALQKKAPEEELPIQGKFAIQKKGGPEEEEPLQMAGGPEEEEPLQMVGGIEEEEQLQMAGGPEEEEPLQMAGGPEEEEPLQMVGGPEEEEPLQMVGGSEEEEPLQMVGGPEEEEEPLQMVGGPEEEELPAQGKFTAQLKGEEEELPAQGKFVVQKKSNNTGLPDSLKSGVENLSGMSMDHVKVHYNSSQPAQLNALAYAQGSDIHVASGQEKHLPHEAWHVVQQMQGRVKPTMQMKEKVPVNNDKGLETEADVMGAKALDAGQTLQKKQWADPAINFQMKSPDNDVAQRKLFVAGKSVKLSELGGESKEPYMEVLRGFIQSNIHKYDTMDEAVAAAKAIAATAPVVGAGATGGKSTEDTKIFTHADKHGGKHLRLSGDKDVQKKTVNQPATFTGDWATGYTAKLKAVIEKAIPGKTSFVDCGEIVGYDLGEATQFVELYYGAEIGSHMRPKKASLIKGGTVSL